MKKDILKVIVKEGFEEQFEAYCKEKNIFCRAYPLEILKDRYRVECKEEELKEVEYIIVSIQDMPRIKISIKKAK